MLVRGAPIGHALPVRRMLMGRVGTDRRAVHVGRGNSGLLVIARISISQKR